MSALAPTLQAWFTDRLIAQRNASPHTIAAYRDTLRLLLDYAEHRLGHEPCQLDIAELDAPLIVGFLDHLEHHRANSVRTRNLRLATIRSLFRYAQHRHPEHAEDIQRVLAIPAKRADRAIASRSSTRERSKRCSTRLTGEPGPADATTRCCWSRSRPGCAHQNSPACDAATFSSPPGRTSGAWGRAARTGSRHSPRPPPQSSRSGSPSEPATPATPCSPPHAADASAATGSTTDSTKYIDIAAQRCPTLQEKHVTPHTLRHTAAMRLLHAGVDTTVIALWLGHERVETTQIYLHADLALKERAIAQTTPPDTDPGRYKPPDTLLAFLDAL